MPHGARPPAAPSRVPRARQNPNMGTAPAQGLARAALRDGCSQDARRMLAARSHGMMLTGCSLHAAAGRSRRAATLGTPRWAGHPCFGAGTECIPLALQGPSRALGGPQQRGLVVTSNWHIPAPPLRRIPRCPLPGGLRSGVPPGQGDCAPPILGSSGQLPCARCGCRLCRSKHGDTWFLGTSGSPRSLPGQSWPRSRPHGRTLLTPWPVLPGGAAPAPAAPWGDTVSPGRTVPPGQDPCPVLEADSCSAHRKAPVPQHRHSPPCPQ